MSSLKNTKQPGTERLKNLATPRRRRAPGPGYTRFVRTMRFVLPLAALALLTVLFSWPEIDRQMTRAVPKLAVPQITGRNELVKPHFESADSQNHPFTITADRAVQNPTDPNVIMLENPAGGMILKDGSRLTAQAQQGAYRQETQNLLLQGDVRLYQDGGYEMTTAKVLVDLKLNKAWSDQAVHGHGPLGTLEASGLQLESDSGVLVFTGPARLILNHAVKGL